MLKKRSAAFATVEMFVFFLVLTPLYVILGPVIFVAIANMSHAFDPAISVSNIGACFGVTPVWAFAVQGAVYLLLMTLYWVPSDEQTNETEMTGVKAFCLLLPVALYVWAQWAHWSRHWPAAWSGWPGLFTGIRLAAMAVAGLIVGAAMVWAAAQYCFPGLLDRPYGRCFTAWMASWVMGIFVGWLAAMIVSSLAREITGSHLSQTAMYAVGGAVCAVLQWASIRDVLETTYGRAISVWIVPFALTALTAYLLRDMVKVFFK